MKNFITVLFLPVFTIAGFSQSNEIVKIVREGIEYHDQGNYTEAIETYKKASTLAPKSGLVNYELALSYFTLGQYDKAIKHSKIAINAKDGHELSAYTCYGNALDMSGNSKKLKNYQSHGVTRTSEKEINVMIPSNDDPDFGAAEMMISLSSAANSAEENKDKTD